MSPLASHTVFILGSRITFWLRCSAATGRITGNSRRLSAGIGSWQTIRRARPHGRMRLATSSARRSHRVGIRTKPCWQARGRAANLAGSAPAYEAFSIRDAVEFLLNAEKWEAPPLLPIAIELQEKVMASYAGTDNVGSNDPQRAGCIANLAMLRARHGDTRGLDAFAEWIQQANPRVLEDSAVDALEPFWRFPNHPTLRDAARGMFGSTNSAWGTLAWLLEARGHLRWRDRKSTC